MYLELVRLIIRNRSFRLIGSQNPANYTMLFLGNLFNQDQLFFGRLKLKNWNSWYRIAIVECSGLCYPAPVTSRRAIKSGLVCSLPHQIMVFLMSRVLTRTYFHGHNGHTIHLSHCQMRPGELFHQPDQPDRVAHLTIIADRRQSLPIPKFIFSIKTALYQFCISLVVSDSPGVFLGWML